VHGKRRLCRWQNLLQRRLRQSPDQFRALRLVWDRLPIGLRQWIV
jgi:hypothetical protein